MPVAQWLEQHPHKMLVASSSLVRRTIQTRVNIMSEVFHIGDLHFGHKNIHRFRPNVGEILVANESEHKFVTPIRSPKW